MKFAEKGEVDNTLIQMIRGNVREPDQLIGDIYALVTCNLVGDRRLSDMMTEFGLTDLSGVSDFILTNSHQATLACINALAPAVPKGRCGLTAMTSRLISAKLTIEKDRILSDWEGTSGIDKKGINVPLVYTKAYACYALKCAIAPIFPIMRPLLRL